MKTFFKKSLINWDFALLWFGGFISAIGTKMYEVAIIWWVYVKTNSTIFVGTLMIATHLPSILLSPIAGVHIDKMSRKKIIVWMDIIRGGLMILIAILMICNQFNIQLLIVFTVLISICTTYFRPAVKIIVPNVVEKVQLVKANSLQEFSSNMAKIIGPALGGIVLGIFGFMGILLINAFSFIFSGVFEQYIKVKQEIQYSKKKQISLKESFEASLQFFKENNLILRIVLVICIMNLFTGATHILLPVLVREDLGLSETHYSMIFSSMAVGAVLTTILLSTKIKLRGNHLKKLVFALFCYGASMAGLSFISSFEWILIIFFFNGIFTTLFNIIVVSILQAQTPNDVRGRVFTLVSTLSAGLMPISFGIFGILGSIISKEIIFLMVSASLFCGALFLQFSKFKEKEVNNLDF